MGGGQHTAGDIWAVQIENEAQREVPGSDEVFSVIRSLNYLKCAHKAGQTSYG